MPSRLRTLLLSFATLVLAVSSAAPALAASGPASPLVRYDSSTWSVVPTTNQTRSILNGVSCVSATDCTAVGSVGNAPETLVESWNGTAWSVVPSPDPGSGDNILYGVSCASATACTAVGVSIQKVTGGGRTSKALVESWNGTAWSTVPTPDPGNKTLVGVSCVSATDCTAVGSSGNSAMTLVESWNGTAWSVVPSPNASGSINELLAVSCVSATACSAVGQYYNSQDLPRTLAESWNGTAWSVEPSPNKGSGENYLTGVSCVSATACTAVGDGSSTHKNRTLVETWDGTAWSVVPSPNKGSGTGDVLTGVSCVSATACTAAGWYFPTSHGDGVRTLVESWNGTAWSAVPTPNKVSGAGRNHLDGVSCVPATACNAVGYYQKVNKGDKSLAESNDVAPSAR